MRASPNPRTRGRKIDHRIRADLDRILACSADQVAVRKLRALDPQNIADLIRICSEPNNSAESRRACAVVLGQLHARKAIRVLLNNLWEDEPDLALSCAHALMEIHSRAATKTLLRILIKCPFPRNREASAMVFKSLRDEHAIPILKRAMLDSSESAPVRFQAGGALAGWKPNRSLRAFLSASLDPEPEVRWIAAYGLGFVHDDRAVAALKQLVEDTACPSGMESVGEQAKESLCALTLRTVKPRSFHSRERARSTRE